MLSNTLCTSTNQQPSYAGIEDPTGDTLAMEPTAATGPNGGGGAGRHEHETHHASRVEEQGVMSMKPTMLAVYRMPITRNPMHVHGRSMTQ